MIVGTLEVQMLANLARLADDMNKAKGMVGGAMEDINKSVEKAKKGLELLGISLSIAGFVEMIRGAIDAADHLNNLSKKTGIAVETLGGIGFAAKQAGLDLDSVATGAGKLNKSIAEAAGGNKEFSAGFDALGINLKSSTGELKTADIIMAEVANKFKDYEDGPEKAAIALRLFGKAGADMIPLLNGGGAALQTNIDYFKRYSGVTAQVAEDSEKFNSSVEKAKLLSGAFARTLAADLMPLMDTLIEEFIESKEKGDGFATATDAITEAFKAIVVLGANVIFVLQSIGREIAALAAQADSLTGGGGLMDRIVNLNPAAMLTSIFKNGSLTQFNAIHDAAVADGDAARKQVDDFSKKILDLGKSSPLPLSEGLMSPPEAKKMRAPILPGTGTQGDDPAKKLLEGQLKNLDRVLSQERDTMQFHDQYVAELRAEDLVDLHSYQEYRQRSLDSGLSAATTTYDSEIAILQQYISTAAKAVDRQAAENKLKEVQDLKEKARQDYIQKSSMLTLELSKAQNELNKEMKEWSIQQDKAADQMKFEIDIMGMSTLEVAKLTEARRIQLDVDEKIRLARKNGDISDDTVAAIQAQAAIAKARATSLIDARDAKEKDPWFNATESIRLYGEEAANTGKQIGDAITNGMKGAEDALVDFVMTGKSSFSDLARSILADLVRIQAKKLIASISSGLGGALGLGGGGGATPFSGTDIGSLAGGFDAAANPFSSFLGGFFADGGRPPTGMPSIVGERGAEVFVPDQAGTVIPNNMLGGSKSVNVSPVYNIQIDSRSDIQQVHSLVMNAVEQGNGQLVEHLDRAGVI